MVKQGRRSGDKRRETLFADVEEEGRGIRRQARFDAEYGRSKETEEAEAAAQAKAAAEALAAAAEAAAQAKVVAKGATVPKVGGHMGAYFDPGSTAVLRGCRIEGCLPQGPPQDQPTVYGGDGPGGGRQRGLRHP
jgi:hypothetical protein